MIRMKTLCKCFLVLLMLACILLAGCSSRLGWGVLLWSMEDPPIPSGTVLPVYIRSNIERMWVVGIPEGFQGVGGTDRMEVPLPRLELVGSRRNAYRRAEAFSEFSLIFAENLQDGLPIRSSPDNTAGRVYRLRAGEIIKVLARVDGIPPISTTGDPLPGYWYHVLAEDGTRGFCFSYRLNLFEHHGGQLAASQPVISEVVVDSALDMLMSRAWSFEGYSAMINQQRINLDALSRNWRFDPGQETGVARVFAPGVDRTFSYTSIRAEGSRSWHFEGTSLSMQQRSDTTLAVQFVEDSGNMRTLLFVSLSVSVDDLVFQETTRRDSLYEAIYVQGPVFTSSNFGTITFGQSLPGGGTFTWRGFDLLVPQHLPETVLLENGEGSGTVSMDLFIIPAFEDRYDGAFTLRFTNPGGNEAVLRCMFFLDSQGFRIEIVPESNIENTIVMRREASPMALYFFNDAEEQ